MAAEGRNRTKSTWAKSALLVFFVCFHFHVSGTLYSASDTSRINSLTKEAYKTARIYPKQSILLAHQALSHAKSLDYPKGLADAYLALGAAWLAKYNPADSATYYHHKALEIYKQLNDKTGQARSCYGLSYVYNFKGDPQKALDFGERSVNYFEQAGKNKETIAALGAVIYLCRRAGNHDEALDLAKKAVELAQVLNDTLLWANALNDQGQVFKDMFLINQAIDSYFEAFRLWELSRDSAGLAIAYGSIANTYFYQEDYRKSLEYNLKKLSLTQKDINLWETNKTVCNISLAYSNLNKHDSALIFSRQSMQIAEELNYPDAVANSYDMMASVFIDMGEQDSALFYITKAVSIAEGNNGISLASYLINLARVLKEQENYKSALAKAKRAYQLAESKHDTHARRSASYLLSNLYDLLNRQDVAYAYLNEYLKLNDSIKNNEYLRQVTRLDIQHEYDKKQRAAEYEIELLDKTSQLKTERLRKTWAVLIALLLVSVSGAIISLLVIRNKSHRIDQMHLEIRNYLLQLDNLKTQAENEDPVRTLVKNYGLTPREGEIMGLISTGIGNEEIAEKLFVSKNTIKFHIKNIFIKLDVRNRVQALHKMEG